MSKRTRSSLGRRLRWTGVLCLALLTGGCASYHALPLAKSADLAPNLAALDLALPTGKIAPARPLTIDQIGLLAVLNDPALAAERGRLDVAKAALLQASVLPNPQLGFGFGALISGPATLSSYTASLSEDVSAILTYQPHVAAARAHVGSVNADLLWQEWQVAEQARLLALNLHDLAAGIAILQRQQHLLAREVAAVRAATAAGSLDLRAEAPLLSAKANAEQALAARELTALRAWHRLDALLGLVPSARFAIARPVLAPPPADLAPLIASLPKRRPDLIALRLGYKGADKTLRAAILAQFPALVLGGSGGRDTSNVVTAGPQITLALPFFDRNQGRIAAARATRRLLRAQYRDRLDAAAGAAESLAADEGRLAADLTAARQAKTQANALFRAARAAYGAGNLDQRTFADYETAALSRALNVIDLEQSLGRDRLTLAVALGLGLPKTRLVAGHKDKRP